LILEEIPSQQGMIIGNKVAKLALYENTELGRAKLSVNYRGQNNVKYRIGYTRCLLN
jgi:hypothetical protein